MVVLATVGRLGSCGSLDRLAQAGRARVVADHLRQPFPAARDVVVDRLGEVSELAVIRGRAAVFVRRTLVDWRELDIERLPSCAAGTECANASGAGRARTCDPGIMSPTWLVIAGPVESRFRRSGALQFCSSYRRVAALRV